VLSFSGKPAVINTINFLESFEKSCFILFIIRFPIP
jgi:hypothetical protein